MATAAALGILVALSCNDAGAEFLPGYFGDVSRLSAKAGHDLADLAPAIVLGDCLDGVATACQTHAGNVSRVASKNRRPSAARSGWAAANSVQVVIERGPSPPGG